MDAVAGERRRAAYRRQRLAGGIDEMHRDAAVVLLDADAAVVHDDGVRPEPLQHRVGQHLVQVAAMDRELRPFVAGEAAARFA